jgi:hypothetical protein
MLISTIIARGLALVDFLLAQWVDVGTPIANASPNGCYSFDVQNVTLNACGVEFLTNLTDVIEGVVALVPTLLGALFSYGTVEAV